MSRIVKEIQIENKRLKALFDTGSLRSYISKEFPPAIKTREAPIIVGLGGGTIKLEEVCRIVATIEGLEFGMTAYIVDELGETEHGKIDAIVGALTMEEWYIKLDPRTGELDLTQLKKREFTEF